MNTISKKLILSAILFFTLFSFTTKAEAFNPITFLVDLYNDIITPDVVVVPAPATPVTIIKTVEVSEPKVITVLGSDGIRGASGSMGPQGPQGIQGPQGLKGEKGDSGSSSSSNFFLTESTYNNQIDGILSSIEEGIDGVMTSIGTSVTTEALTVNGDVTITGTITGTMAGTLDPNLTAGSVLFQSSSAIAEDNTNLFWDDTNNFLGIGTSTPSAALHIQKDAGSQFMMDSYISSGTGAAIIGRTARGTSTAATAIQLDDVIFGLDARGYDGSSFGGSPRAAIYMKAAENWTSSAKGMYISFETNLIGSSLTRTEKMRITDNGNIGMGDSSPDYRLELHDAANTPAFALSDDDIAHGVTTLVDTDVFAHLSSISTTVGGAQLTGLADATGTALILRGIQSSDPTDTTPSVSVIAAKASGTGIVDLAAAETVFRVANNDDTSAITVLGSASVGLSDTTPDALLDVRGTVCLDLNADDVCTDNTSALSDSRLKTNVTTITNNLDLVKQLRPVRFTWNGLNNTGNADSLGFIAQEVENIFPELIITDTAGYKNLDYSKLVAVVAGGVQELDLKVQSLDARLLALETNNGGIINSISNGVSDFMDLIVRTLKIGSPEKRTGITFYDEVTGEPYCLSIANGEQKVVEGECGIFEDSAPVVSSGGGEEITEEPVVEDVELLTEEVPEDEVVPEVTPEIVEEPIIEEAPVEVIEELVEEAPAEEPATP